jgi:hypothetical protein
MRTGGSDRLTSKRSAMQPAALTARCRKLRRGSFMAQTPLRPFHGRIERPIKFELHNHSDVRAIASRQGDRIGAGCCVCSRPLMAQSGHSYRAPQCPLLGVKRTSGARASMSVIDPSGHPTVQLTHSRTQCSNSCRLEPLYHLAANSQIFVDMHCALHKRFSMVDNKAYVFRLRHNLVGYPQLFWLKQQSFCR